VQGESHAGNPFDYNNQVSVSVLPTFIFSSPRRRFLAEEEEEEEEEERFSSEEKVVENVFRCFISNILPTLDQRIFNYRCKYTTGSSVTVEVGRVN
jgi:hypothetical protein